MTNQPDTTLLPFLNSLTKAESEKRLADLLIAQIQPVIEKTLRAKLRVSLKTTDFSQSNQEALEIAGDVKLLMISELEQLKANPNGKVIHNLNGYVVSVTTNAYRQFLRTKYPLRGQLKNKLRYLLTHHPKFALWDDKDIWLCGFRQAPKAENTPDAETLRAGVAEIVTKNNLYQSSRIIDLVGVIFDHAKVPLRFNDLLSAIADIQDIKDRREISEGESFLEEKFAVTETKTLTEIEQREYLEKVWTEICELPIHHRRVLLLNLKDRQGDCVISLFPLLRIASIRRIAETLEFPPEEFASIWNELPWDDLKIAAYLGLTRQQIINLRQSARARLVRLTGEKND